MAEDRPVVSVILPAYNCAGFLPDAMASIRRQGHTPVEVVIVDDGSTDDTAEVARSLGPEVRCIRQDNQGPAAARNAAILAARGSILAMHDADDLWPEDKFATQVPLMLDDPTLDLVIGMTQTMVLSGCDAQGRRQFRPWKRPWEAPNVGAALFRRRVFDRVGLFDPAMRMGEDVDWMLRAREAGVVSVLLDHVTLLYCLHDHNSIRGVTAEQSNVMLAIKRSLDRRRRQSGGEAADLPAWSKGGGPRAPHSR